MFGHLTESSLYAGDICNHFVCKKGRIFYVLIITPKKMAVL